MIALGRQWIVASALLAMMATGAETTPQPDLKSLYASRKWAELYAATRTAKGNPLYRAAAAVVFNHNPREAEAALRSVIQAAPGSEDAYDAYEWLLHLYLRAGQYRRLTSAIEERWAAFPQKARREDDTSTLAAFRGLPDQTLEKSRPSVLPHERQSIFIPLSVNGTPAEYFFDTGAGVSCISESEAKRLGLQIRETGATIGTTTAPTSIRTAVAREVIIGEFHFKNVSFAVLDDKEPFSSLDPGKRGIIGLPLILGFRTLRWFGEKQMEIGGKSESLDVTKSNIHFEDDQFVVEVTVRREKLLATLDTGAENTDLFAGFAEQFASLLRETGKRESFELKGMGGTETLEAITMPSLILDIGGRETVLRPARVLRKGWRKCCAVNVGMDLLKQARSFKLDFGAMTLALEGNP